MITFESLALDFHLEICEYLTTTTITLLSQISQTLRQKYGQESWRKCVVITDHQKKNQYHRSNFKNITGWNQRPNNAPNVSAATMVSSVIALGSPMSPCTQHSRIIPYKVFLEPEKYSWFLNNCVIQLHMSTLTDSEFEIQWDSHLEKYFPVLSTFNYNQALTLKVFLKEFLSVENNPKQSVTDAEQKTEKMNINHISYDLQQNHCKKNEYMRYNVMLKEIPSAHETLKAFKLISFKNVSVTSLIISEAVWLYQEPLNLESPIPTVFQTLKKVVFKKAHCPYINSIVTQCERGDFAQLESVKISFEIFRNLQPGEIKLEKGFFALNRPRKPTRKATTKHYNLNTEEGFGHRIGNKFINESAFDSQSCDYEIENFEIILISKNKTFNYYNRDDENDDEDDDHDNHSQNFNSIVDYRDEENRRVIGTTLNGSNELGNTQELPNVADMSLETGNNVLKPLYLPQVTRLNVEREDETKTVFDFSQFISNVEMPRLTYLNISLNTLEHVYSMEPMFSQLKTLRLGCWESSKFPRDSFNAIKALGRQEFYNLKTLALEGNWTSTRSSYRPNNTSNIYENSKIPSLVPFMDDISKNFDLRSNESIQAISDQELRQLILKKHRNFITFFVDKVLDSDSCLNDNNSQKKKRRKEEINKYVELLIGFIKNPVLFLDKAIRNEIISYICLELVQCFAWEALFQVVYEKMKYLEFLHVQFPLGMHSLPRFKHIITSLGNSEDPKTGIRGQGDFSNLRQVVIFTKMFWRNEVYVEEDEDEDEEEEEDYSENIDTNYDDENNESYPEKSFPNGRNNNGSHSHNSKNHISTDPRSQFHLGGDGGYVIWGEVRSWFRYYFLEVSVVWDMEMKRGRFERHLGKTDSTVPASRITTSYKLQNLEKQYNNLELNSPLSVNRIFEKSFNGWL